MMDRKTLKKHLCQSGCLIQAKVNVHALDGCAGGPFAQIVDPGDDGHFLLIAENKQICPVGVVACLNIKKAQIQTHFIIKGIHPDKWFIPVEILKHLLDI
jgi:hypothetical protein